LLRAKYIEQAFRAAKVTTLFVGGADSIGLPLYRAAGRFDDAKSGCEFAEPQQSDAQVEASPRSAARAKSPLFAASRA
jgi:hypothetical protein